MAETKLKLDLEQGILEVEGSESFVRSVYNDFKEQLKNENYNQPINPPKVTKVKEDANGSSVKRTKKTSKKKLGNFLKELHLSGEDGLQSLRDFYSSYIVKSNYDKNLIFTYYLERIMKLKDITLDHIFTCYRTVGVKVPGAFEQSLWDTSSKKHWLDTESLDNIKVTALGIHFIENEMTKS